MPKDGTNFMEMTEVGTCWPSTRGTPDPLCQRPSADLEEIHSHGSAALQFIFDRRRASAMRYPYFDSSNSPDPPPKGRKSIWFGVTVAEPPYSEHLES